MPASTRDTAGSAPSPYRRRGGGFALPARIDGCGADPVLVLQSEALMTLPQRSVTALTRSLSALGLIVGWALSAPAVLAQSPPAALSGNWQLACTGRGGQVRRIAVRLEQQGTTLSGSYSGGHRSGKLRGSVRGNEVSLALQGKRKSAQFTGTTDGNTLQVHTAKGVSCTATRQ